MASYRLYAVKYGTTHIPVVSASFSPQVVALGEHGASTVDPTALARRSSRDVVNFTTAALGTALTACGATGAAISSGTPLELYFGLLETGGTYASGSVHTKVALNAGYFTPVFGGGGKDSAALAQYAVFATYDGTNAPFEVSTNVALPTVTQLSELYSVHSVVLAYPSTTLQIPITDAIFATGNTPIHDGAAGNVFQTFAGLRQTAPVLSASSAAIKTVLDAVALLAGRSCTSAVLYIAKMAQAGGFTAGASHISVTLNDPLAVIRGVSVSHGASANLALEAMATYDGTNGPLAISTAATLPAATALSESWGCGPMKCAGETFAVASWSIDTGIQVLHDGDSGDYRPTLAAIMQRAPRASVDVFDVGPFNPYGGAETDATLYLRKQVAGGTQTAEATEEHIEFKMASAISHAGPGQGERDGLTTQNIMLEARYDGTNAAIAVDTTAAIS